MKETLSFELGKPQFFAGDKIKITVESQTKALDIIPSEVALHESMHAVAANANGTGVSNMTIQPSSDYLGLTELSRFDPVAAVAPHSMGAKGTGYDIMLVEQMGKDVSSLAKAARGIINNNWTAVEAVAKLLEEKGTISGFEAKQAINSAGKPKEEKVKAIVETPDGKIEEFADLKVVGGTVMIPGVFYSLSERPSQNFDQGLQKAA